MSTLSDRITLDPTICHGKPTVRGMRYPVEMVLQLLDSGMTHDEILADHPDLETEDIVAVLEYADRSGHVNPVEELRVDRTAVSVVSLSDDSDERVYWHSRTPAERLCHVEILRRINYGSRATERLQRVLEFARVPWG